MYCTALPFSCFLLSAVALVNEGKARWHLLSVYLEMFLECGTQCTFLVVDWGKEAKEENCTILARGIPAVTPRT